MQRRPAAAPAHRVRQLVPAVAAAALVAVAASGCSSTDVASAAAKPSTTSAAPSKAGDAKLCSQDFPRWSSEVDGLGELPAGGLDPELGGDAVQMMFTRAGENAQKLSQSFLDPAAADALAKAPALLEDWATLFTSGNVGGMPELLMAQRDLIEVKVAVAQRCYLLAADS